MTGRSTLWPDLSRNFPISLSFNTIFNIHTTLSKSQHNKMPSWFLTLCHAFTWSGSQRLKSRFLEISQGWLVLAHPACVTGLSRRHTGICLAHGLSASFLSNIMPVHKGADWHIQVKREEGPKPVPSVQDDFWNTQCLGLRAKTPCNPCIQGLFVKQNWIPPHRGLMIRSYVPKISAFCPWNLWSY